MEVYRITSIKWADILAASGYSARWNSKGVFMVYTAWSRSLACLEHRVHINYPLKNFVILTIDIPDSIAIEKLQVDTLPPGWETHGPKGYAICQSFGDIWINDTKAPVLQVPSAIIPQEFNFLINPEHKDSGKIKIIESRPFIFDSRLFERRTK